MTSQAAQDYLFQQIRNSLPGDQNLVDIVSDILHVSADSAYRRIRGETPLVLDEAQLLCKHFKLSLDQLLEVRPGATLFYTDRLHYAHFTFDAYLAGIRQQLEQILSFSKKEIIYVSKDLPFFHNFSSEPLFAFHYFFWMKSILRHPDFAQQKFSLDCLTPTIREEGKKILNLYNQIPSTEIWNTECVNSIIFQVEYYREAGLFQKPADVHAVYGSVLEVIAHLKEQAEHGCKHLPGENHQTKSENFRFFHNRITLGDNTILAISDERMTVFVNYDVINYMTTTDTVFCQETFAELQALIKRCTQISTTSEKQRNMFFNMLTGKIEDRKKTI